MSPNKVKRSKPEAQPRSPLDVNKSASLVSSDAPLRQCPNLEGHALSWPHFANGRDGARPSKLQIRTLPPLLEEADASLELDDLIELEDRQEHADHNAADH